MKEARDRREKVDPGHSDEAPGKKRDTITQKEMAKLIGIGWATYQQAESGKPIDRAIANKIAFYVNLDETTLGFQPSSAPPERDTRAYLQYIHARSEYIDIKGLMVGSGELIRLPISKHFIKLRIDGAEKERGVNPEDTRPISLDQALDGQKKLVVVGDPGSGKSTFLQSLAFKNSGPDATYFPIPIGIFALERYIQKRIQGGAPDTEDRESANWIPRYLGDESQELNLGLDAEFFRRKLREESSLILLDGLDETPTSQRREAIARLFERASQAFRNARIVVTTRPDAYVGKATLNGFTRVRIGELDNEARDGFLKNWSGFRNPGNREGERRDYEKLSEDLRAAQPEIRRMSRNPLMLTALAVIHEGNKLPERRAELYESILTWLSRQRDHKDRRQGLDCLAVFGTLAFEMQTCPDGRLTQIETGEAASLIAPEFREAKENRRVSTALTFLESELIDSGIVVKRGDLLAFKHLTFLEYMAARACADFDRPAEELRKDDRWRKPEWREVLLLVAGVRLRGGGKGVDAIFRMILDEAGRSASLAIMARAAGLLGAVLWDLRPTKYLPPDEERYNALMNEVRAIRDPKRAAGIELRVRVEAGEALGQAGDPVLAEDNWVAIPAGTFLMGAQKTRKKNPNYDEEARDNEPLREETIKKEFQIGRYPVTVEEYKSFLEDEVNSSVSAPPDWDEQLLHLNRPVVSVSWNDATAYCAWATLRRAADCQWGEKQQRTEVHLPTEEQWEYVARGGMDARKYPWGNQPPDPSRANYYDAGILKPTPVGLFPAGNTPEGVADMAGNVWEWTSSEDDKGWKVVRGAAFLVGSVGLRAAFRGGGHPDVRLDYVGFRCVRE